MKESFTDINQKKKKKHQNSSESDQKTEIDSTEPISEEIVGVIGFRYGVHIEKSENETNKTVDNEGKKVVNQEKIEKLIQQEEVSQIQTEEPNPISTNKSSLPTPTSGSEGVEIEWSDLISSVGIYYATIWKATFEFLQALRHQPVPHEVHITFISISKNVLRNKIGTLLLLQLEHFCRKKSNDPLLGVDWKCLSCWVASSNVPANDFFKKNRFHRGKRNRCWYMHQTFGEQEWTFYVKGLNDEDDFWNLM